MNHPPEWVDKGHGFECDDSEQMLFGFACEFMCGFDLPRFDLWVRSLPVCGLKQEMIERRSQAHAALLDNNQDAAFRHLEWMLNRQRQDSREQFLIPLAQRDKKRQEGTRKERRPEISRWIEEKLRARPASRSTELWSTAPEWITDQIGQDRFSKRVTAARKKLNGRK